MDVGGCELLMGRCGLVCFGLARCGSELKMIKPLFLLLIF